MSSYGLPEAEQLVRKHLAEQGDDATQVVMDEYDLRGVQLDLCRRSRDGWQAEAKQLRFRDAEAAAVVNWWTRKGPHVRDDLPVVLVAKLDALAASHQEAP